MISCRRPLQTSDYYYFRLLNCRLLFRPSTPAIDPYVGDHGMSEIVTFLEFCQILAPFWSHWSLRWQIRAIDGSIHLNIQKQ